MNERNFVFARGIDCTYPATEPRMKTHLMIIKIKKKTPQKIEKNKKHILHDDRENFKIKVNPPTTKMIAEAEG